MPLSTSVSGSVKDSDRAKWNFLSFFKNRIVKSLVRNNYARGTLGKLFPDEDYLNK